jgi:hypothetical protein
VHAVDVGVGHQHDLVIARLVEVEVLADAGAERRDQRLDLGVGQDLVDAGLLDVEDLAADRQDRLGVRVAPCTAEPPAESPSTMKTSTRRVLGLAVAQLAGQAAGLEQALAGGLARLAGGDPGAAAAWIALRTMSLPSAGGVSSQSPNSSVIARCTKPLTSELPSLVLVWPSNCGSPSLTEMTAVRPSRMSSPVRFSSLSLSRFTLAGEVVDQLGQRRAEALLVGAALVGVDRVGVGVHRLAVGRGPLHRQLEAERAGLVLDLDVDDLGVDRVGLLRADEVLDVVDEPAVVAVGHLARLAPEAVVVVDSASRRCGTTVGGDRVEVRSLVVLDLAVARARRRG